MKKIKQHFSFFYKNLFQKDLATPHQRSPFLVRWRTKKRILLYTDSRGINISKHFNYQHYSTKIINLYDVDAYLCPEKWTTTLDFFALWERIKEQSFDSVILHTGIVDFSPRHQKVMLETIYTQKKQIFDAVLGEQNVINYLQSDLGCDYEDDKTINMYSLRMAEDYILPRLLKIPNLIWISPNRIDTTWRGNYWKDRPANIRLIEEYAQLFVQSLPRVINLLTWDFDQVHQYTFDNMHPNRMGSDFIFEALIPQIEGNCHG